MPRDALYLRSDVQVEPLVDQWYAWSHLLSPATAARNVTERHLKIMDSYIAAPEAHAAAVKDPRLLGGPFIDHGGGRVDEIRSLRDRTRNERSHQIELSVALGELNQLLTAHARGFCIQDLYPKTPEPLRGRVELVYDLNNQPSFRLVEPLLYSSRYHDPSLQSLTLSTLTGDDRPFALSTPRLPDERTLTWQVPFSNDSIDVLFAMKARANSYSEIRQRMAVRASEEPLFSSFFTPTPPPPYSPYQGPTARWRYFGHACVLVEMRGTTILCDPVLSYTYESTVSRYTYFDLPDSIDYVLITHNHQDHVLFETLLQLRHKVRHIVVPRSNGSLQDPSLKLLLEHAGFRNVIEMSELESIPFENGSLKAIPFFGEHADLDVRCKSAYLVRCGPHSILFLADSCNVEPKLYEHLHDAIGDVDALFIGMECVGAPLTWLYGPLITQKVDRALDQSRRLAGSNFEQAIDIVSRFRCKEVYVYAMGQEPWLNYVMSLKYKETSRPIVESNRLIAECGRRGISAERLFGEREMFLGAAVGAN